MLYIEEMLAAMAPRRRSSLRIKNLLDSKENKKYGFEENIDHLSSMPPEIFNIIMGYLHPDELFGCLRVSKSWFNLINNDLIWKKHCMTHGVPDNVKFTSKATSKLCQWAQIWKAFRLSSAYGWRTNETCNFLYNDPFNEIVSDGTSILFIADNIITLRRLPCLSKSKALLRLPNISSDKTYSAAVNKEYIAYTKHNLVFVYKAGKVRFRCIFAVSIVNSVVTIARNSYQRFIRSYLKKDSKCINILAFCKGCIWLRDYSNRTRTYVLDVKKQRIIKMDPGLYEIATSKFYVMCWSRTLLSVDTFSGRNILQVSRDVLQARVNETTLITLSDEFGASGLLEAWCLKTGEKFYSRPVDTFCLFELHPSFDVLYILDREKNSISAYDFWNADTIWSTKLPAELDDSGEWLMQIVSGMFLVLQQNYIARRKSNIFVIDCTNGDFLYQAPRADNIVHFSENLIITTSESSVRVFSYQHAL